MDYCVDPPDFWSSSRPTNESSLLELSLSGFMPRVCATFRIDPGISLYNPEILGLKNNPVCRNPSVYNLVNVCKHFGYALLDPFTKS